MRRNSSETDLHCVHTYFAIYKFLSRQPNPRANGAKRRSGHKPGARVTNFVLAEFKVVARGS